MESNSIAESKESKESLQASVISNAHSYTNNSNASVSSPTNDLSNAVEQLSKDIASTFNNIGATFMSSNPAPSSQEERQLTTKGQSKGFIDACWLVPDEPAIAMTTAQDPTSFSSNNNNAAAATAVPGIKEKLQLDDNSSLLEEAVSPMQRIRKQKQLDTNDLDAIDDDNDGSATNPSSPSRRSQGEVVESWKRKMKLAQKKREQEANELHGGGDKGNQITTDNHDETDHDDTTTNKTDEEHSFIKREDDTFFREEDDDNSNVMDGACQPKREKDGTLLDPIFSAAMTLEGIPSSRKEFMDMVTGKCRVMIGADEQSATSSEETDEWSDSYMTPDQQGSPRRRRKQQQDRRGRSGRSDRKSRRGRSREDQRRGTSSKSPKRQSRAKQMNHNHTPPDDLASAVQSEITMTPEHNREYRQRPASPPRRQHQRTPPSNEKMTQDFDINTPTPITPDKKRSAMKTPPSFPTAPKSPAAATSPKDKNFIKYFIQEISNRGYRMMWYKEPSSKHPTTVVLFLQHGHKSPVNANHSGPAMVWVDESERDQFYGVNLFDIRTLDRASHNALGAQSYAMPSRSIVLRLAKGNEFIFEAPTEQEAFRFVHGMKWVIARLAFNLVIGNMDVVCELVDVDKKKGEATIARAMDDVTLQMVDKSILKIVQ
ncbi:unnamed protein product [Cylindrotheca closterium]|uniref:Uncharacterized protein n=1 Tax=Cylindrotheca closterium TaxID=2856 RepID=A0AAD2JJP1_9STRA|nr:unnamed protein product [Cylindrotheca closterium]